MRTLLMASYAGRPEHTPEAEPVIVDTDAPRVVRLELHSGDVVELDRVELVKAIETADPSAESPRARAA